MAILVDVAREEKVANRDLERGVPLVLDQSDKNQVVMTKFISNNPRKADWQPAGEWFEQVVTDVGRKGRGPAITVHGIDGEVRGVSQEDGLIIDLVGTMSGLVGIVPGLPPMSEEQIAEYEAATEKPVPLYQRWDFRITRILKTNGPELRVALSKTEEQKRTQAQSDMFKAFTEMFQLGAAQMAAKGETSPSAAQVLSAGVKAKEGVK
jgi:hypothetical protein